MYQIHYLLQKCNHNKFGFPIFRTSYKHDNDLWSAYIEGLYHSSLECTLEYFGRKERLGPFFYCPVIEDRATLDGASKDQIRERFKEWVKDTSDARDGNGAVKMWKNDAPTYQYCLMVDEECLERFSQATDEGKRKGNYPAIFIQGGWFPGLYRGHHRDSWTNGEIHKKWEKEYYEKNGEPAGYDEDELTFFDEIEGSREAVLGWMFTKVKSVPSLYDCVMHSDGYYDSYTRPPDVYPGWGEEGWKLMGTGLPTPLKLQLGSTHHPEKSA